MELNEAFEKAIKAYFKKNSHDKLSSTKDTKYNKKYFDSVGEEFGIEDKFGVEKKNGV